MDVKIFGRLLKINCPDEKKECLQRAVVDLSERLESLKLKTGVSNTEQLIFVTALNIYYELEKEKNNTKSIVSDLEKKLLDLSNKLETIC